MTEILAHLQKLSVPVFLVSSMLATGLMLTPITFMAPLRNIRLVLLALGLNFVLPPAFAWLLGGSKPEERGVLGIATTARNFGAALVLAATSFSDPKVTIMIIVGAIVCLIVSFLAAGWLRRGIASAPA